MANYKSIGYTISRLHRLTEIYLAENFQDLGLYGSGQVRIVLFLGKHRDGVSQDDLAHQLAVDKATVSRMIRPLLENGIVERRRNREDRRAYVVQLSEKIYDTIPEIRKRMKVWTETLKKGISEEEMERFFCSADVMLENARNFFEKE